MKRSRFGEEQIIGLLKEHLAGMPAADPCRQHGISDATFYDWRSTYGGMEVSQARKLKVFWGARQRHGSTATLSRPNDDCGSRAAVSATLQSHRMSLVQS